MDFRSHISRLFEYDEWANREVLSSLQALPYAPHKAIRLFAHVVGVEFLWLARLQGQVDPPVWPEWNLQEIARQQDEIVRRLAEHRASLSDDGLTAQVQYTNTKGERWTNSVGDILMHVVMHSAYHRGQIAIVLRDTGIAPPYTDYIQAVRTQKIEE